MASPESNKRKGIKVSQTKVKEQQPKCGQLQDGASPPLAQFSFIATQ